MCGSFDIKPDTLVNADIDAVVTGEIKHHQVLELNNMGIYTIAAGHHGTERFFVNLADKWIKDKYPDVITYCYGFDNSPLKPM